MTYLTVGRSTHLATLISDLATAGYSRSPLTKPFPQFLAEALSGLTSTSVSHLTTSVIDLLVGIDNALRSRSDSSLALGYDRLLASAANDAEPGPYVASAVHFDGDYLDCASLIAADTGAVSFSGWFKVATDANNKAIFVADPDNDYINYLQLIDAELHFAAGVGGTYVQVDYTVSPADTWMHVLGSIETDHAMGSKRYAIYRNDVAADFLRIVDGSDSSIPAWNGKRVTVGGDGSPSLTGDVADLWLAPGVSLLDINGVIPEATRRQFISADDKPVNPDQFPSSAILFSGDSAGFVTNQGSGGAFTLIGTLTNATTSPSD